MSSEQLYHYIQHPSADGVNVLLNNWKLKIKDVLAVDLYT